MEYKLPSGAVLDVTPLDFEPAFEVSQTITRLIGLLDVDLKSLDTEKWGSVADIELDAIKRPFSQILSNRELVKDANKCLAKCTYNGIRVSEKTWQPAEARKDYLYACFYALKENVFPFFEGVFSSSKA